MSSSFSEPPSSPRSSPDAPTSASLVSAQTMVSAPQRDPEHVGNYRVVKVLGRGGMGSVYLGERDDKQFRQQVAIKLINRGMDSEQIVRRFQMERRVLATLNHPNVARLIDGGVTEDERPYFVMEYVDGVPIDQYCDRNRLRVEERLKLFRAVCAAVQYAHQNLVVHRDIKPSNILVGADGAAKLVDFGIAKLLNPALTDGVEVAMTVDATPMTPEYASPEQVRGDPITTSSDIYSLGVVLYELLTGKPPYRLRSRQFAEIERVVCTIQPERPSTVVTREDPDAGEGDGHAPVSEASNASTAFLASVREGEPDRLQRRLRGDVDNIILMALRKEPQRRYASAEQFSEDIDRHLKGLPVIAAPDKVSYRLSKFVQRRRFEVAAGAIAVLSLVAGLGAAAWTARINAIQRDEARVQRDRAERRFQQVRDLARTLMFDVYDSVERLQGSTPAREVLVGTSLQYLENLSKEVEDNIDLKAELAAAFERVGDVQGGVRSGNLGQRDAALASYRRALTLRQQIAAARPDDPAALRELSGTQIRLADVQKATGDASGSLQSLRDALAVREKLAAADPAGLQSRRDLAVVLQELGDALDSSGDLAEATRIFTRSLELRRTLAAEGAGDPKLGPTLQRDLSTGQLRMAQALEQSGDSAGALAMAREAVAVREHLLAQSPDNAREQRDVMTARQRVGQILLTRGDAAGAADEFRFALGAAKSLADADPANARARRDLLAAHESLGDAAKAAGRLDEALDQYRALSTLAENILEADRDNRDAARFLAGSRSRLGDVLLLRGEPLGALEAYRAFLNAAESAAAGGDKANTLLRRNLAIAHYKVAGARLALEEPAAASDSLRRAEVIHAELAEGDPANLSARLELASTRLRLGDALSLAGDRAAARAATEAAVATLADAHTRDPGNAGLRAAYADSLGRLAVVLRKDALYPDALAALDKAESVLRAAPDTEQTKSLRDGIATERSIIRSLAP